MPETPHGSLPRNSRATLVPFTIDVNCVSILLSILLHAPTLVLPAAAGEPTGVPSFPSLVCKLAWTLVILGMTISHTPVVIPCLPAVIIARTVIGPSILGSHLGDPRICIPYWVAQRQRRRRGWRRGRRRRRRCRSDGFANTILNPRWRIRLLIVPTAIFGPHSDPATVPTSQKWVARALEQVQSVDGAPGSSGIAI